ncbi:ABC transporter permease [Anaerosacchariphilus polymeriproducens]|uniref:ABC transporter permease n=1 Tax=Anaerosacchariphilus polymeriproducens TaxID=1812858 RepID=A0A371AW10_9FIRM|nr:ABC transporter permease subunit [Anaerosacchariphilus polymeriproducens]RDU23660.1 ABC transporter permease [Anaerosacchariphilus polymeriproducens]
MKTFFAFLKKENMELIRSGRLALLLLLFVLFGIMNPAIAKMTPWLIKMMASSLENTGLLITEIKVDAMTSWTQYYKNIGMLLIIFVLFVSNTLTKEYQKGTLILVLTKGLSRFKVVLAKTVVNMLLWTLCYWMCFGITYGYNAYFWDNSIALHLFYAAFCYWLFGIWILSLVVFFSSVTQSNTSVLIGTGGIIIVLRLLSMFSSTKKYLPIKLMEGFSLLTADAYVKDYNIAVIITIIFSLVCIGCSIISFNRKMI